jgi:hypothetical protein
LRDDRLFIIACDDTYAPKQYFEFFRIARIQVHVVSTTDGTSAAQHVLTRLLAIDHEPDDELWLVLDTDHCIKGGHVAGFLETLTQARHCRVNVALSRPCFELWLLLHHSDESALASLSTAGDVEAALRLKLGEYNKTKLKQEHYPLTSVSVACSRAENLDKNVVGGEIPASNTSRVYLIWKAIAAKALRSQLPKELESLVPCTQ